MNVVALIILGSIGFITGVMLILFPNVLQKASSSVSKTMLDVDKFIFKTRYGVGISLMLVGSFFWFVAYYFCASKTFNCF